MPVNWLPVVVAIVALVGCGPPPVIRDRPIGPNSSGLDRIRERWMITVSLRYCDDPVIDAYSTEPVPTGPATFIWRAHCPDGQQLRCTGVPRSNDSAVNFPGRTIHVSSTTMEGECRGLSDESAAAAPAQQPVTRQEVLAVISSAEAEARACMGETPPPRVQIWIQINGDGSAIYTGTEPTAPAETAGCLRRLVAGLRFRSAGGEPLTVATPALVFERPVEGVAPEEPDPEEPPPTPLPSSAP